MQRCQQRSKANRRMAQIEYGGEFITLLLKLRLLDETQAVDRAAVNVAATKFVRQLENRELVIMKHDSATQNYILTC